VSFPAVSDRSAAVSAACGGTRRYSFPEAKAYGYSYDVIVIGGGTTASSTQATSLALERSSGARARHILGGAPAPKNFSRIQISVCSYVVSLLRRKSFATSNLPRHGLEILPLDGTFTPMPAAITCGA